MSNKNCSDTPIYMNLIEQKILDLSKKISPEIVYVAASGGVDSMLLLLVASNYFNVEALHVNYKLRGSESDEDQKLVENFCSIRGIPHHVLEYDLKAELESKRSNLQNRAREIRYEFFENFLNKNPNSFLFIAHHADDQIETFFLQYYRNSGIAGLSVMKEKNNRIIRPFLCFNKAQLIKYAQKINLEWREDISNKKNDYLRNRFRNEIIPKLEDEIPSLKTSVLRMIQCFQSNQLLLQSEIQNINDNIIADSKISLVVAKSLSDDKIIELLRQLAIGAGYLKEWKKLLKAQKGSKIVLHDHSTFQAIIREGDSLFFQKFNDWIISKFSFTIERVDYLPKDFTKNVLYCDAEKLIGELIMRKWKIGDRIYPIGINGSKLISDVLTDAKIPNNNRENQFVLCDQEKILCCIGLVIDRRVVATLNSKQILRIQINSIESSE